MVKLSIYSNHCKNLGPQPLSEIYELIKGEKLKEQILKIRHLYSEGKIKAADEIKSKLLAFTPSGTFDGGRLAENLITYSKHIILDYDKIPESELPNIIERVNTCMFTKLSFISPRGKGLKILVGVTEDFKSHSHSFKIVADYYDKLININCDRSGKDIPRLCYFSYDPSAYYNPGSESFNVTDPSNQTTSHSRSDSDIENAFNECEKIAHSKFEFMNGSRNNFVFFLACNCNRMGIQLDAAMMRIVHKYGYDIAEVESSVRSAYNSHKEEHNTKSPPSPEEQAPKSQYAHSLKELIERYDNEPKPQIIYKGIIKNSFGFVVGPPKSGKTTYCENLALNIAIGKSEYLGHAIGYHAKVFLVFMEEHWSNRVARIKDQLSNFSDVEKSLCQSNIKAIDDTFPRYINDDKSWSMLEKAIAESGAEIVFIDSFSRFTGGKIEESSEASKIVFRLKALAEKLKVTMICIHHTPKQYGKPITIESLAGSRILGAEADFTIGVSNFNGIRYVKDVAFRYRPEDEEVQCFEITDTRMIKATELSNEQTILNSSLNSTHNNANDDMIVDFIANRYAGDILNEVSTDELLHEFVDKEKMGRSTLFGRLKILTEAKDKKITKIGKGSYTIVKDEPQASPKDTPQDTKSPEGNNPAV